MATATTAAIRNKRGDVKGHIELYWSPVLRRWVSIPPAKGGV